jgi:hypothetical protein
VLEIRPDDVQEISHAYERSAYSRGGRFVGQVIKRIEEPPVGLGRLAPNGIRYVGSRAEKIAVEQLPVIQDRRVDHRQVTKLARAQQGQLIIGRQTTDECLQERPVAIRSWTRFELGARVPGAVECVAELPSDRLFVSTNLPPRLVDQAEDRVELAAERRLAPPLIRVRHTC